MSAPAPVLDVDVISDIMCPWCYIGKRRLERALGQRAEISVDVRWQPFQLDPTIPREGMDRAEYLNRKFGPERAKEVYNRIKQVGAEEGIPFAFDKIKKSPNTIDAHRVIRWAAAGGDQQAAVEHLFAGYFVEGRDLTNADYLAEMAADAGLEREVVTRLLAGDADRDKIAEEVDLAKRKGVRGVPCFIFGGKYVVTGAQDPTVLVQAIDQAVSDLNSPTSAEPAAST